MISFSVFELYPIRRLSHLLFLFSFPPSSSHFFSLSSLPIPFCSSLLCFHEWTYSFRREEYLKQLARDALWSDPMDTEGIEVNVRGKYVRNDVWLYSLFFFHEHQFNLLSINLSPVDWPPFIFEYFYLLCLFSFVSFLFIFIFIHLILADFNWFYHFT